MNNYTPSADSTTASVDVSTASTSLLTDMYELTMLQGTLTSGAASQRSVFELFGRRLSGSRRFSVVAGTGRLLDAVKAFTFTPAQIDFLHRAGTVNDEILDFLRDYRFSRTIRGYIEDECYFTGSLLLTVEDTFAEACILKTLALSICNYGYTVTTAAPRMTTAARGHPCVDFRARWAHRQAAVATTRASVVGGFVGMSNLKARLLYDIPTTGASAHSFILLHDTEEGALAAQVASLGSSTTILVDTYDIATGVERAVKAARAAGSELGAVRLDSGDLVAETLKTRAQLNALGATSARITVANDLDEYAIAALGVTPVDFCGMGTKLVADSGCPTTALVYKLTKCEGANGIMEEAAKFSSGGKPTVGDHKWTGRILSSEGTAVEELVVASGSQNEGMSALSRVSTRPLQVLLTDESRIIEEHYGKKALSTAAERHRASRAELPYDTWHLSDGESALPTRHVGLGRRGAT